MRRFRPRLTYANVMATLALFIALGGTGYAALKLPRNSVGSAQLRRHAVTNSKIAPGAVSASRVKANSLTGAQINEGALGKVPSASLADHASSADSAGTAATARNADTLNGVNAAQLRVGCPAGTTLYAGDCFETDARPAADWVTASRACTDAHGRLPTADEETWYIRDHDLQTTEWTGDLSGSTTAVSTVGQGGFNSQATSTPNPFRCVLSPTN